MTASRVRKAHKMSPSERKGLETVAVWFSAGVSALSLSRAASFIACIRFAGM